jgi:hypothetical protein
VAQLALDSFLPTSFTLLGIHAQWERLKNWCLFAICFLSLLTLSAAAAAARTVAAVICCCQPHLLLLPSITQALRVHPPRRATARVGSPCRC